MSELVATLVAGAGAKLSKKLFQKLSINSTRTEWLAPDEAADIFADGIGVEEWREKLRNASGGEPIDVIVQPAANRRKKFLAADMESTVIEQELLDELADQIGARAKVAHITQRTMNGELDFAASLRARVALFADRPLSLLENAARRITYMPGAETLIGTMKKHNAKCWLITGGFSCFAEPVAAKIGFDKFFANDLIVENGKLTGSAREPILDRNRKRELLEQGCAELKLPMHDCIAVGDGANDVPMLETCNAGGGLGIAFHAKPYVREQVPNQINHGDLTALLYAQGYKKATGGFL